MIIHSHVDCFISDDVKVTDQVFFRVSGWVRICIKLFCTWLCLGLAVFTPGSLCQVQLQNALLVNVFWTILRKQPTMPSTPLQGGREREKNIELLILEFFWNVRSQPGNCSHWKTSRDSRKGDSQTLLPCARLLLIYSQENQLWNFVFK